MTPAEEITALKAVNARVQALYEQSQGQVTLLLARVRDLEARLARDSHNSGKPPASDGLRRKAKSLRKPSGKKAGGQLGHRGQTLYLVAVPDGVEEHRPLACAHCQASLDDAPVVLRERRQVHELPPLRLLVREHQAVHVRCPACHSVTVGAFPEEVPSRVQYGPRLRALVVCLVHAQFVPFGRTQQLLVDLLGVQLARGTVVGWVQQAAQALQPVDAALKAALRQAPVLHHDETGVRRAGQLAWAHVASTARLTHYAIHARRGAEATDAIGILPDFAGVSMHDGWTGYRAYTACRHALCNVHHLRALTFLEQEYHQAWAGELKGLQRAQQAAAESARAQGLCQVPTSSATPSSPATARCWPSGWPPIRRRPGVVGQANGAAWPNRLRARGYLATLRKQGRALLAALETVFTGQPLYPAFA
jgi:transposase